MLKIRLTRKGKKNKAFYRLVVAEHTSPVKGRFLEALGFLNPHTKERDFKNDRIKYWIEKGAQCSDSAHNLLVKAGIIKGAKRAMKMKKKEVSADSEQKTDAAEAKPEEKAAPEVASPEKEPEEKKEAEKKAEEPEKKEEAVLEEKKSEPEIKAPSKE